MDKVFKECYCAYIFSLLPNYKLCWQEQVKQLNDIWETVSTLIDKQSFNSSFTDRCLELSLCSHKYNLELSFEKALSAWRVEIMTLVANKLIVFWDVNVPLYAKPAVWNESKWIIDSSVCKAFTKE